MFKSNTVLRSNTDMRSAEVFHFLIDLGEYGVLHFDINIDSTRVVEEVFVITLIFIF